MSRQQIKWVEAYMMPLKEQGLIEPEEERHQWVFHVAVSGKYADLKGIPTSVADGRDEGSDFELLQPAAYFTSSNQKP